MSGPPPASADAGDQGAGAQARGAQGPGPEAAPRPGGLAQQRLSLVVAALVVLLLVGRTVVYQVRDSEVAVVLTFGRATRDDAEPGPHLKWPWPIQQVRHLDGRLRVLKTPLEEMATADRRPILVATFALWRVASARALVETAGDTDEASRQLGHALRSRQLETISEYPFGALVSTDRARLRYDEIEGRILEKVRADARRLGLEVEVVGIRRLGLPEAATAAVFERMKKEREARAAELQAEGEAEAGRIRAAAERERDTLLAEARAAARRTLSQAELDARVHYEALAQDPELATFLKKLEALEALLARRTTLVLDTSGPPFDLLDPRRDAAPGGPAGRAPPRRPGDPDGDPAGPDQGQGDGRGR